MNMTRDEMDAVLQASDELQREPKIWLLTRLVDSETHIVGVFDCESEMMLAAGHNPDMMFSVLRINQTGPQSVWRACQWVNNSLLGANK